MTLFAGLATLFLFASIVTLGIQAFFLFAKKDRETANKLQSMSILLIVYFVISGFLAMVTKDPIPYFDVIFWSGLFVAGGIFTFNVPSFIATEVKRELEPEKKITYRKLPLDKAREEIIEYLEHRKGETWIENIIDDLKIEPEIVIKVIRGLHRKGMIKEVK